MLLRKILGELGFEVSEAEHGREGLERLRQLGRADLVMVDWNMPEMNGYELIKAVRQDQRHDAMPVVMVTTENELSKVVLALEAGANEYIMKPFTREVIVEKLQLLGVGGGA
jgi:two-component system chemotaxis response regulator CheY